MKASKFIFMIICAVCVCFVSVKAQQSKNTQIELQELTFNVPSMAATVERDLDNYIAEHKLDKNAFNYYVGVSSMQDKLYLDISMDKIFDDDRGIGEFDKYYIKNRKYIFFVYSVHPDIFSLKPNGKTMKHPLHRLCKLDGCIEFTYQINGDSLKLVALHDKW